MKKYWDEEQNFEQPSEALLKKKRSGQYEQAAEKGAEAAADRH